MLALTMGEPAGIGGELTLKAWSTLRSRGPAFAAFDDPARLAAIDPAIPVQTVATMAEAETVFAKALPVLRIGLNEPAITGRPNPANAPATIASIERAVQAVTAGAATAVVTNPIAKSALYAAGFQHPGHTEFLGALTGARQPVMMLANQYLRVVPVTVHVSLRTALETLSTALIVTHGQIVARALRRQFGIPHPRLAVAGLNPHAGEQGAMGDEEAALIAPAVAALQAEGIDATGPHPPDTLFTPAARAAYDAVLCMYHDQALIPLKTLDMASGVNVTLGLPIIRTSPDHGTAFDIAGAGRADPSSLIAALEMAAQLSLSSRNACARCERADAPA